MTDNETIWVRTERAGDAAAIRTVHERAFGRADEADIVDALRAAGGALGSLVGVRTGQVVGHVAFSPVRLEGSATELSGVGLAPLAVAPEFQRKGVGAQLVFAGIGFLKAAGHDVLFVLGDPAYYERFGFRTACEVGFRWEGEAACGLIL